ncbi:MAG: hypothetical protein V3T22_12070 [Planctomycetota bacterium]
MRHTAQSLLTQSLLTRSRLFLVGIPLLGIPLFLCSGCAAVAAAGSVVIVTDAFMANAITVSVEEDVDIVWPSVKATLANMTDALIHVNEDERLAETKIDNAVVMVYVKTNNVRETEIRITAKKILIYNGEIASMVQRRIVKDVTR